MFDHVLTRLIRFLVRLLSSIFAWTSSSTKRAQQQQVIQQSTNQQQQQQQQQPTTVTSLDMLANQFCEDSLKLNKCSSSNNNSNSSIIQLSPVMMSPQNAFDDEELYDEDSQSKWKAMRLKKHFTVQTSLLLKEGETSYVGAFATSSELRTIKKSPLSFLPFVSQLFSRTEFMLVKSAILVFVTARSQHNDKFIPRIEPYQEQSNSTEDGLEMKSNRALNEYTRDDSDSNMVLNRMPR
jgi:hypothetical protein